MSRFSAWLLAARPGTLAAAAAPVVAGSALATADRAFVQGPALAALVGALLIQIGSNFANDYYDFVKGGDTAGRVGPARAAQTGLLAPRAVWWGMAVALALAFLVGVYLVWVAGWPIVVIGLTSLLCAYAYTGGPFPLAYHGLGDLFVLIFFGPVAVAGTYYVQALSLSGDAVVAGVGLGLFSTAILVVNNLRDWETDAAAGKRTLAVRFGERFAVREYLGCLVLAGAVPVVGILWLGWSPWTLLAFVGLGRSVAAARLVIDYADRDRRALNPALLRTAHGVAFYGGGLAIGFIFGGS